MRLHVQVRVATLACFVLIAPFAAPAGGAAPATRPTAPATSPGGAPQAGSEKLTVPGVFSVAAPQGYAWQTAQAFDPATGGVYLATAEGVASRLVVTADARKIDKDPQRISALKAHFNAMAQTMQKMGLTDLKFQQPKLEAPIPERVDYWVSGLTPDGARMHFYAQTVFVQRTYQVQAASPSEEDAKKLIDSAKSLQEPK